MNELWQEKLNECLAIDLNDPAYFQFHHILVLTYMLQCNRYDKRYQAGVLDMLGAFLKNPGLPDKADIKKINAAFSSSKRNIPIVQKVPVYTEQNWALTILDIRTGNAKTYGTDLLNWAASVYTILRSRQ